MNKASGCKASFSLIFRCFLFTCVFMPAFSIAQTRGTVKEFKDPRIDSLIARRNSLKSIKGGTIKFSSQGYRIQIYSGSNRKEAYNIQARFQSEYPAIRTYISYRMPDFKLHVGDFRSRLEAEKQVQDMKGRYSGLIIMRATINPPKSEVK
ncbi:SPOR domain-containing protein [Mucilaginibacter auburnensis]|uniref:Sporulation related protein n=1 Tax=Mucilaginibacter auburnensis TaxID=1457233 RepID=A0A2H9VNH5_9SPHI|nr:SPOR domain-containing protein [Mucilaginibacter auburnensis]PJJ79888.1 sporulation related protein [Mucilaginibacter auburnensis]